MCEIVHSHNWRWPQMFRWSPLTRGYKVCKQCCTVPPSRITMSQRLLLRDNHFIWRACCPETGMKIPTSTAGDYIMRQLLKCGRGAKRILTIPLDLASISSYSLGLESEARCQAKQ